MMQIISFLIKNHQTPSRQLLIFFFQNTNLFLEQTRKQSFEAIITLKITRFSSQCHVDVAVPKANKVPPHPLVLNDPTLMTSLSTCIRISCSSESQHNAQGSITR